MAISFGLKLAGEAIFSRIEIELNNLQLIRNLQKQSAPLTSLSMLEEVILALSNNFVYVSFNQCKREANESTYHLTRLAYSSIFFVFK